MTEEPVMNNSLKNALHRAGNHAANILLGLRGSERAMKESREGEPFLNTLIDAISVPVFCKDRKGRYLAVNKAFETFLGATREQLVGKTVFEIYPRELAKIYHAKDLELFKSGREQQYESQVKNGRGELREVIFNKAVFTDSRGTISGLIGTILDITERKRVENIVQARLRLVEFASSHSLDELLTATLDEIEALTGSTIGFYHFVEPDQKTLSLQNWSTNTLKNMCAVKGKHSHYAISQAGVWVDCVLERRPVIHNDYASLPHRKGMPDGHAPVIREVVVPIFRGDQIRAIIGVGNKSTNYGESDIEIVSQLGDLSWEIAERKKTEEALSYLAAIVKYSEDAIIGKSMDGTILSWNRGAERLYGYRGEEIKGRSVSILIPQDLAGELPHFLENVKNGKPIEHYETTRLRKDGSRIGVSVTISPIRDSGGKIVGASTIARDVTARKQIEEKLRLVSSYTRSLIEASLDPLVTIDVHGRITDVNTATESVTGRSRTELIGTDFSDYFTVPGKANEGYQKVLAEGLVRDYPLTIRHVSGKTTDVLYNAVVYNNEEGKIQGVFAAARDVTERKRAEEAVRAANAYNRSLIEASLDPLVTIGPDGKITDVNRATETVTGVSREQLVGDDFSNYFTEPGKAKEGYQTVLAEGLVRDYPLTIRHVSGKTTDVLYNAAVYNNAEGKIQGVFAAARDITERKRAMRALEDSEAKTRSILDNIGIGVALISPQLEVLELNRQMREWFPAIDPAQHPICYRVLTDSPRETACDHCPTNKTLQDGQVHESTQETTQRGVVRNYRVISFPVLNASGEVTAAIEIVEDITEKLSLESQLRQAQRMESVGLLAGGVAHDFNNMLGVIIGYTALVMEQVDPAEPLFGQLQEIRKAAERSADLTRQLLAFARKQTVSPKVLDLNETVEGMLKMLRRLIGEDINLTWVPRTEVLQVKMDPSQIDHILANLCVNARDAISGVGKITIETNSVILDEAYCAEHTGFVPGEYVLLVVSDDGSGMDKETLDRLFEPFFTTKEIGRGTGLGLATVYGIVKQNSGFINVYSEPGHGASFHIYLPRYAGRTEQAQKDNPAVPAAGGNETILLVEDEPSILDMARVMLKTLGYRVLTASTPGEAVRVAGERAGEIHLLITDVIMPEMNGRDLANKLMSLHPGIRHLFMSGYTAEVIAQHGMLEEGVNYIQKPFSMQTLATTVREALDSA